MTLLDRLAAIQERGGRAVLFTVVEGPVAGEKHLVEEGETGGELAEHADEVIRGARNTLLELPGRKVFGEVIRGARRPRRCSSRAAWPPCRAPRRCRPRRR